MTSPYRDVSVNNSTRDHFVLLEVVTSANTVVAVCNLRGSRTSKSGETLSSDFTFF